MLKRIAVVFTIVAALAAAAPVAPAAPAPIAAPEIGSGDLAWGVYFSHATRPFYQTSWAAATTLVCNLAPLGLGIAGVGAVAFGLGCGFASVA